MNAALLSSASNDWCTPPCVLDLVRKLGRIGLDPCSNPRSIVHAQVEFSPEKDQDGLQLPWAASRSPWGEGMTDDIVYCNPPYGRALADWADKIKAESYWGAEILALVPARTDTAWFRTLFDSAKALCFWGGRITFMGAPSLAPFPSMVTYHGPRRYEFAAAFCGAGRIVLP